MKEVAYFLKDISELNRLPQETQRLYIGSESCIRAFPKSFKEQLEFLESKDYSLSLLTPPIIESELPHFYKILEDFEKIAKEDSEVIINDWGILEYLRRNKKKVYNIRLGRLLTYQKRGTQNLYDVVKPFDLSNIPILDDKTLNYLKKFHVTGIDIDIPIYGISIENPPEIHLAVYIPFVLSSYTLNCPFTFDGTKWSRKCQRECLTITLTYSNDETTIPFLQKGKIYYSKNQSSIPSFIKRVVFFEW